ncbi:MAG: insulinase family protein [Gemmatimonadetes bacterium]|nr:insulinase family protein [Gemmatimonadota bacterium]
MRNFCRTAGAVAALLLAIPAAAQQTPSGDTTFEMYELANGLRVILAPDRASTSVAVNVWYDVGSRHERPGRSGFGHLFEHLMFQGSENVARGEHMQFVERAGGSMNASITEDRTNYFQTVPPNRYNLALWLESDRMRSLQITEENMKREVEVVKEERRLRIDNAPYGTSQLQAFYYAPYDATTCFPYGHSVIGSMEDLDAAEVRDVQQFFDTYYAPNNATLTVVGDFDPAEARGFVEEYFGGIPRAAEAEPVQCTEPFSHLPTRQTVTDGNAQLPAFFASYGAVPAGHADSYALSLLGSILGVGESSRLHQRLVRQEQAALAVQASPALRRGPGIFMVFAIANQGVGVERLDQLLGEEIERVRTGGVTADELEKAKNRYRANAVLGRQTTMGRAEALQWHNHFLGDPGAIQTEMERHMAVSAVDIRRVANQYLTPQNRAVILTQPATAATQE